MVKVEQVGLKRGRCLQCKEKFTSYTCAAYQARVCVFWSALADSTKATASKLIQLHVHVVQCTHKSTMDVQILPYLYVYTPVMMTADCNYYYAEIICITNLLLLLLLLLL